MEAVTSMVVEPREVETTMVVSLVFHSLHLWSQSPPATVSLVIVALTAVGVVAFTVSVHRPSLSFFNGVEWLLFEEWKWLTKQNSILNNLHHHLLVNWLMMRFRHRNQHIFFFHYFYTVPPLPPRSPPPSFPSIFFLQFRSAQILKFCLVHVQTNVINS